VFITHKEVWSALLSFASEYNVQIFTTTHSKEWLIALIAASQDSDIELDDLNLWRIEWVGGRPKIFEFNGHTLLNGIEYGVEPRGGKEK